jgi:hypothetical protein
LVRGCTLNPPRELTSLLQLMFDYPLGDLARMFSGIIASQRDLLAADAMGQIKPQDEYCPRLAVVLDGLAICCESIEFDPSLIQQIRTFEKDLKDGHADTRCPVLQARLSAVIEGVQLNLDSRKFMYVQTEDAHYWNNLDLFGEEFKTLFPLDAVLELREAGNCFTAHRATACIFHCMRLAEYGLRRLAKKLKVRVRDKGAFISIEFADWNKVIEGIRNKIKDLRLKPAGVAKNASLQFYSDAADHCEYMKDVWRNEISHTRRRNYSRQETLGVFNRVRDFLQLIAKREMPKSKKRELELINRQIKRMHKYAEKNK